MIYMVQKKNKREEVTGQNITIHMDLKVSYPRFDGALLIWI